MREYQREWMRRRRDAWIEEQGGCCRHCGSTEQLEVDHIDRATKKLQPRDIWSRRAEVREAELSKCQVLCAGCHKAKTISEIGKFQHGTSSMYSRGCRCDECRARKRDNCRAWRAAKVNGSGGLQMVAYTFGAAQVAGMIAGLRSGSLVLVVGKTPDSVQAILDGIEGAGMLVVTKRRRARGSAGLTLADGTRIVSRAATSKAVRGMSAHLLVTEAGVGGDTLRDALPCIAATRGTHLWVKAPTIAQDAHEPTQDEPTPIHGDAQGQGAQENPDPTT